jgi:inosose dehydratase
MLRVGCQTYTWEMLGDAWRGSVDDMLKAVADAGYEGIEITNTMIREYADRPRDFKSALENHGLKLAAFAYAKPTGFTKPEARADDLKGADQAMRFVESFPGTVLGLGGASSPERTDADRKIGLAADFYNEVGKRGRAHGIEVVFHPHSHHGSLLESRAEYARLMELTDDDVVNWNPDTGHIVRGGQDLIDTLRTFGARIRHVHLKDADNRNDWQPLGKGVCDIPAVLALLEDELDYSGWIVGEEESADARRDQVGAILGNRKYLKSIGH